MSKAKSYSERLEQLKGSAGEQVKELIKPVLIDLACGFGGWFLGKYLGQKSLLIGLGVYGLGRYHSLRMAMTREEQREQTEAAAKKDGRIANLMDKVYGQNRIYHGESPLSTLGMSMMIGGATAFVGARQSNEGDKGPWQEIKEDLKHRLYLDKFFNKTEEENKQATPAVSGIGEINYFLAGDSLTQDMNLSVLDNLDKQMEEAAISFQNQETRYAAPAPQSTADSFSGFPDVEELEEIGTRIL